MEQTKHPDDRWSQHAKRGDTYWRCACGLARVKADAMFEHLKDENDDENHFAYYINASGNELVQNGKMVYFQSRA